MANVTTTTAATFIPEIWAQTALQALRSKIVLAQIVTKDTDVTNSFTTGDVLHIPVVGTYTANNKAAGSNVTAQAPTDGEVTVTLNKHKEVTVVIEDAAAVQANQSLMERYAVNAIIPIAEAIEDDLFALYAGFSASAISGGAAITAANVRTARANLNSVKAPEAGRALVVNPNSEVGLLADADLQSYFAFSQPEGPRNGYTGRVYGFDVYMSQRVPLATTYKNLALTPEAMILAMRSLPETGNPGVDQVVVSDPVSGLAIRQTVSYNANALGVQITWDVLYGVAELRDACGQVITTTS